jgi:hypothetical protein
MFILSPFNQLSVLFRWLYSYHHTVAFSFTIYTRFGLVRPFSYMCQLLPRVNSLLREKPIHEFKIKVKIDHKSWNVFNLNGKYFQVLNFLQFLKMNIGMRRSR